MFPYADDTLVVALCIKIWVSSFGNLCFAFITPVFDRNFPPLNLKDFNDQIVKNALNSLNIQVESKGRNDITLHGLKISGSAFEVDLYTKLRHTRVLHHGTVLVNVNLSAVADYLNPNVQKLKSKVN